MKSLSDSHEEFCNSQQTMQDRMTEIYEMLAKTSNGENSRGRNHEYEGENSFKFFWNEDERAKIEKIQLEFIMWKEKSNKKIEEHMRKIESFSTPSPAPASQSFPITPAPQAATVKRKKRVVEATKNSSMPTSHQTTVDQPKNQTSLEPATSSLLNDASNARSESPPPFFRRYQTALPNRSK
jgi:hypothetical protein